MCYKKRSIYLSKISRELSCLSSGLPKAFLRSLFNSSTARTYSPCSSPAGYVAVTNFDSGFTKSTSEDFFNGTEINVAISARQSGILNREKQWRLATKEHKQQQASHFLDSDKERQITSWETVKRVAQNQYGISEKSLDGKKIRFVFPQTEPCTSTTEHRGRINLPGFPTGKKQPVPSFKPPFPSHLQVMWKVFLCQNIT